MWNVLIADDEPKIRQGLKNTLETFDLPLCVRRGKKRIGGAGKSKGI